MQITSKSHYRWFLTLQQISVRALQVDICKFEGNRDRRTRCTKCWSNLTLKCYANTFVKVDARIKVECRQTISNLKGYSCLKLYCKKQSNQKPAANIVGTFFRRTTLCAVILKNFYWPNVSCICPSLFETNLNKAKYSVYEKLSRVFSIAGSCFEEE